MVGTAEIQSAVTTLTSRVIIAMSNPFAKAGGGGGGGPPAIPSRATKSGESEAEEVVERTLIVKGECLVYRIPPQVKLNTTMLDVLQPQ